MSDDAFAATKEPMGRRASYHFGGVVLRMVPEKMRRTARRLDASAPSLGRIGSMEVRLARTAGEIKAAQQLRYRVFYEEMSAQPSKLQKVTRRDADRFDRYCDHLLVIDHDRDGHLAERIVGTYRLLRDEQAEACGGFYTQQEFDIAPMLARHRGRRFMELGRSCVLKDYRSKRTVELLWQGIWAYVVMHGVDVLFGCASLHSTDPQALALPLAYLSQNAQPPAQWQVRAHAHCGTFLRDTGEPVNARAAIAMLPPLLKGYLRLGGYIGEGAVVDHQFGTTDVLVVLPKANIASRYVEHYSADSRRVAA